MSDSDQSYGSLEGSDTGEERYDYTPAKKRVRSKVQKTTKCRFCNIVFNNRGNLLNHLKIHGIVKEKNVLTCNVCFWTTNEHFRLYWHIRKEHFNLVAKIPYYLQKKVNQVWFEKVMDTDTVMEIKKTSMNSLVMRKLGPNTSIKVSTEQQQIDLTHLYPSKTISNVLLVQCDVCNKMVKKPSLKKHIQEKHKKIYKFKCNNCGRDFKRMYQYTYHKCSARKRIKNKSNDEIVIK